MNPIENFRPIETENSPSASTTSVLRERFSTLKSNAFFNILENSVSLHNKSNLSFAPEKKSKKGPDNPIDTEFKPHLHKTRMQSQSLAHRQIGRA